MPSIGLTRRRPMEVMVHACMGDRRDRPIVGKLLLFRCNPDMIYGHSAEPLARQRAVFLPTGRQFHAAEGVARETPEHE